jgi:hypothetical protein
MASGGVQAAARTLPWRSVKWTLVQFPALLLPAAFPSESLLRPALVTGLQIERMLLDILDDIFLLHLSLEAAQRALDGFALLDLDFSQASSTPLIGWRPRPEPKSAAAERSKPPLY